MTEPSAGADAADGVPQAPAEHEPRRDQPEARETGFWKKFPPEGVEVVSWYVMMGIGQVVTLRLPAEQLRAVNLAIEQNAWGAFETEFYPTYDFRPVWQGIKARA